MEPINLKKEVFFQDAKPFIEAELIKSIYATEELCICNLANQCYAAFVYDKSIEGQAGFLITPTQVREIINDNNFFNMMVTRLNDKELSKRIVLLNQETFKLFSEVKKENDIKGPSQDINFEMEEEIMAKNKSR